MTALTTLIFVYNADDGLYNAIAATAHRIFSPATYECHLCLYTHDLKGMRATWKRFLESLGCPLAFYYRREFHAVYPNFQKHLPAILIASNRRMDSLLTAEEILECGSLDALIRRISLEWQVEAAMQRRVTTDLEASQG